MPILLTSESTRRSSMPDSNGKGSERVRTREREVGNCKEKKKLGEGSGERPGTRRVGEAAYTGPLLLANY